jgi:hypothetical protein
MRVRELSFGLSDGFLQGNPRGFGNHPGGNLHWCQGAVLYSGRAVLFSMESPFLVHAASFEWAGEYQVIEMKEWILE